jgi:hypothetical protein
MYYALKSLTDDTDFIKAEDVRAEDQNNDYYCPCVTCRCRFGFRSMNSNKRKNCFFKLPSSTHSETCFVPYVKSGDGNKYDYETESLSPDTLLRKLENYSEKEKTSTNKCNSTDKKEKKKKPITTLRQLYCICASNEPQTELNDGLKVVDLFAGRNTAYLYTRYIDDIKLVECRFANRYYTESNTLLFLYPYNEEYLTLSVRTEDSKLFKEIRKKLWKFDEPVVIFAKWNNSNCVIKNSRQIIPLK